MSEPTVTYSGSIALEMSLDRCRYIMNNKGEAVVYSDLSTSCTYTCVPVTDTKEESSDELHAP